MEFYVKEYRKELTIDIVYPCVVLITDYWDDYNTAETLFHMMYYKNAKKSIKLGEVKIMHNIEPITRNVIPSSFKELDEEFCSLGQTPEYYRSLNKINNKNRDKILKGLNDAAINPYFKEKYRNHNFFKSSLIRFSEASKALKDATNIINGVSVENGDYKFDFSCTLKGSSSPHNVKFDFQKNILPYRINAFVGKNATGKTSVLNEISKFMSGVNNKNILNNERPPFSKIITISYSAFDEMYKPFEDINMKDGLESKDDNKLFSYIYCGLRSKNGILKIEELETNFWRAYGKIKEQKRLNVWIRILSNIFEKDYLEELEEISKKKVGGFSYNLSSGQNILLYTMSEVIANIQPQSLLMFDEPETHLHPNAVANLMRLFYEILEEFDSFAIVSTHSPLIMQEIPSRYVHVFNRYGNTTLIEKPYNEFFGENISNITNILFEVQEHESNYKTYLKRLLDKKSSDEIIELFDEELSFNALTYLSSLNKG